MLDMHATSEVGHTVTLRHTQHCSCDPSCSHTHREEAACPRPACTTGSQRLCVLFGLAQLKDCTDACFCKSLSSFSNREVSREITVNFVNPLEKDQQESPDSNRYLHTRFGVNKHLLDCKTRVLNSRLEQLLMFGLQEVSAIKKKNPNFQRTLKFCFWKLNRQNSQHSNSSSLSVKTLYIWFCLWSFKRISTLKDLHINLYN